MMNDCVMKDANILRAKIKEEEGAVRRMAEQISIMTDEYDGQAIEMHEQAMLAVRALEDARMRLGKVCQYATGGISIYDKL